MCKGEHMLSILASLIIKLNYLFFVNVTFKHLDGWRRFALWMQLSMRETYHGLLKAMQAGSRR